MKILIVSDTHRSLKNFKVAWEEESPVDMLIHLGDIERQMSDLLDMVDCETYMIAGNNDFLCGLDNEMVIEIGEYKAFLTHGHRYMVGYTDEYITEAAREHGADIAMFGHTHVPYINNEDLLLLNPGSMTYPRQSGRRPSYMVMEVDEENEISLEVKYL